MARSDDVSLALDLYAATFDLMIASRQARVRRRMQHAFTDLQDAVRVHAPWAMPELAELLLALTEAMRLLQSGDEALEPARAAHAAAFRSLRGFLGASSPPWG